MNRLVSVKSIVTIALTVAFVVMAIRGEVNSEFVTIYTTVIGFYFGTQAKRD